MNVTICRDEDISEDMTIDHVLYTGCDVMNTNLREHNVNMSIKHLLQLKYMFSKMLWDFGFKYENETEVRLSRKKDIFGSVI